MVWLYWLFILCGSHNAYGQSVRFRSAAPKACLGSLANSAETIEPVIRQLEANDDGKTV